MKVYISRGNSKIGFTHNVSLLPIVTCDKRAGCTREGCYACGLLKVFKSTKRLWVENTKIAQSDPAAFMASIAQQFGAMAPGWFRWFVGDDVPSLRFARELFRLADRYPMTRFLIFSKRYAWINRVLRERSKPANLSVIFSAWPRFRMDNPHGLPVAWMHDPKNLDERIPENAIHCPGTCEQCGMCWDLARTGLDVVFEKH